MAIHKSNDFVTFDSIPTGDPLTGPTFGRVKDTLDFYHWNGSSWILTTTEIPNMSLVYAMILG